MNQIIMENGLQKAHLYEQVADLLERQIIHEHKGGVRLPSEQQLAEQYQVSRTIIREALKLLKERGLIDSKIGSGAYVTIPEAQNMADVVYRIVQMNHIDYVNVFDMRTILETESISRAAKYVTNGELYEMEKVLDKLKEPDLTYKERSEYDFDFHYMIAKASRNPLLAIMIEAIGSICREIIHRAFMARGGVDDSIIRHDRILKALQSHDERAARQSIVEHLEKSKQNYEEYLKGQSIV